jgi:hypothetical protein
MTAVVALLWPKNESVLWEYLSAAPPVIYVDAAGGGSSHAFVERAAAHGVRVESLDHLVLDAQRETLAAEARRRADELLDRAPWDALAAEHRTLGLDAAALRDAAARGTISAVGDGMLVIEELEVAASRDEITLIVVGDDVLPRSKAAALWGRARGIPVLHVSHGCELATVLRTSHREFNADAAAVFAERGRPPFRTLGVGNDRMPITGNPAWDGYPELMARKAALRDEVRARYGVPAQTRLVVFATTAAVSHSAFIDPLAHERSLRAMFAAFAPLARARGDVFLIVKDRVLAKRALADDAAAAAAVAPDRWAYELGGLAELVVAADCVVSVYSNVAMEAMLAEVPAVNLWTPVSWYMGPGYRSDEGVVDATIPALGATIARVLDDDAYAEHLREQMRAARGVVAGPENGGAARRVAAVMRTLQSAGPNRGKPYDWSALADRMWHALQRPSPGAPAPDPLLDLVTGAPRRILLPQPALRDAAPSIERRWPGAELVGFDPDAGSAPSALAAGSLDAVVLPEVLARVADPWRLLAALRPLLAPGAPLVATVPNLRTLTVVQALVGGDFPYHADGGILDVRNLRHFTLAGFEQLFAETGFAVRRVERAYNPILAGLAPPEGAAPEVPLRLETPALTLNAVLPADIDELRTASFSIVAVPRA